MCESKSKGALGKRSKREFIWILVVILTRQRGFQELQLSRVCASRSLVEFQIHPVRLSSSVAMQLLMMLSRYAQRHLAVLVSPRANHRPACAIGRQKSLDQTYQNSINRYVTRVEQGL